MDLTDIYRTFHPKTKEYIPYSHHLIVPSPKLISHKTGFHRCILLYHQGLRLVVNSKKNNRQPTYTWKLNNFLLNDSLVNEELDKEIKNFRI